MADGFNQGWIMSQQMWNPYLQSSLEAGRLKKKLELERSIKEDMEIQQANKLFPLVNRGRGETKAEEIPIFQTKYGAKSPAFRSATGEAVDPNMPAPSSDVQSFGTNATSGREVIGTPQAMANPLIQQQLAEKQQLISERGQNSPSAIKQSNVMEKMQGGAGAPLEALAGLVPFVPKVEKGLPIYSQDDILAAIQGGFANDLIKPQLEREQSRSELQVLQELLGEEKANEVFAAKKGGSAYIQQQLLPAKIENMQSQNEARGAAVEIKKAQLELNKQKQEQLEAYRAKKLISDEDYRAKKLALESERNGIMSGQLAVSQFNAFEPTTTTTTDEFGETKTSVRSRGAGQPAPQATQKKKALPPPPVIKFSKFDASKIR